MTANYHLDQNMQLMADKQLISDTCRIWRDIDKHPLPEKTCKIDVMLRCGSMLLDCTRKYYHPYNFGSVHFGGINIEHMDKIITQWRLSK